MAKLIDAAEFNGQLQVVCCPLGQMISIKKQQTTSNKLKH